MFRKAAILFSLTFLAIGMSILALQNTSLANAANTRGQLWKVQSIDTMKYSRDVAREKAKDASFDTTINKKTVATGSIMPRKEVNMKSQVSGIIEKLYIVAGQQVKQGDVIAKIKKSLMPGGIFSLP